MRPGAKCIINDISVIISNVKWYVRFNSNAFASDLLYWSGHIDKNHITQLDITILMPDN